MDRFIVTAGALLHDSVVYVARYLLQRNLCMYLIFIMRSVRVTEEEEGIEEEDQMPKHKSSLSLNFTVHTAAPKSYSKNSNP